MLMVKKVRTIETKSSYKWQKFGEMKQVKMSRIFDVDGDEVWSAKKNIGYTANF